jgi:hypothetical protein
MFDRLVILTKGSPVYSGGADESIAWFKNVGMELPPFVNPAEFLIDIAAIDNRSPELEATSSERVERLKLAWVDENRRLYGPSEEKNLSSAEPDSNIGTINRTSSFSIHSSNACLDVSSFRNHLSRSDGHGWIVS